VLLLEAGFHCAVYRSFQVFDQNRLRLQYLWGCANVGPTVHPPRLASKNLRRLYPFSYLRGALSHSYKRKTMSETMKPCPNFGSPFGYSAGEDLFACPECGHEWNPLEAAHTDVLKVLDSNGNELKDGDSVIVIKDLPVKGAPKPIKVGTKVKNIRLTDGDHNIDCKIDGFGSMALKSEFVRKA